MPNGDTSSVTHIRDLGGRDGVTQLHKKRSLMFVLLINGDSFFASTMNLARGAKHLMTNRILAKSWNQFIKHISNIFSSKAHHGRVNWTSQMAPQCYRPTSIRPHGFPYITHHLASALSLKDHPISRLWKRKC